MIKGAVMKIKHLFVAILPQISVIFFIVLVYVLAALGLIPSPVDLVEKIVQMFEVHGLLVVGICSFFENLVGINIYTPGSIAVLMGMSLTSGQPMLAVFTYLAIVFPALLANVISYVAGKYLKMEKTSAQASRLARHSERKGRLFFFYLGTCWHPHLASITAYLAGAEGIELSKHFRLLLAATIPWSLLYAVALYQLGRVPEVTGDMLFLFYGYLVIWLCRDTYKFFQDARSGNGYGQVSD